MEQIREPWRSALEFLKLAYLGEFSEARHSVYVRGSVPRGLAVRGVSDVESFALLHGGPADTLGTNPEFAERFPFATHGELDVGFVQVLLDGLPRGGGIMLKTLSSEVEAVLR